MSTCGIGFGLKITKLRCRTRRVIARSDFNRSQSPKDRTEEALSPNKFPPLPRLSRRSRWPYAERIGPNSWRYEALMPPADGFGRA
jgi:hypothetical protein